MSLYYLLENISLPENEKQAFFDLNKQEGDLTGPYPNLRNHQRERPDGEAIIFEGDFPLLNIGRVVSLLAQVHDGNTLAAPQPGSEYGDELIIRTTPPGSVDLCRVIFFGGISATWEESHALVLQYLAANSAEWEEPF